MDKSNNTHSFSLLYIKKYICLYYRLVSFLCAVINAMGNAVIMHSRRQQQQYRSPSKQITSSPCRFSSTQKDFSFFISLFTCTLTHFQKMKSHFFRRYIINSPYFQYLFTSTPFLFECTWHQATLQSVIHLKKKLKVNIFIFICLAKTLYCRDTINASVPCLLYYIIYIYMLLGEHIESV